MTAEALAKFNPRPEKAAAVVITCAALTRELMAVFQANAWSHMAVECLPAELHSRPERIPGAVKGAIDTAKARGQRVFVAYGDCGTGGRLDALLKEEGVERISGAHCYEFFAGKEQFEHFQESEVGTFYITDFLVRHFNRLVIRSLGLDRKPELEPLYFGNYRKLLYLAQTVDAELKRRAREAARRLDLAFEYHYCGNEGLARAVVNFDRQTLRSD
ncbi:MAG: DUF1638 domain-containing protein [Gammaproteobacteria bacterium]|nr:DUF1638 domain-containing protein [Gammaproteobacteria bacterium]